MLTALYVKTTLALESFVKDQRGVTAIEYAVIAVAMSSIVAVAFGRTGFGSELTEAFRQIASNIR